MILYLTCCAEVAKVATEAAKDPNILKWLEVCAGTLIGLAGFGWVGNLLVEKFRRKSIVKKYRHFICYAAWALQDRIGGILNKRNIGEYFHEIEDPANPYNRRFSDVYSANMLNYTMFLFCQFFAWREIINREMYNFKFRRYSFDSKVLKKLIAIEKWFSTTSNPALEPHKKKGFDIKNFLILRGEQRVLGDMCVQYNKEADAWECISFSDFVKKWNNLSDSPCYMSVEKLENDIRAMLIDKRDNLHTFNPQNYRRLILVRNSLLDLLDLLDNKRRRHPENRERQ